MSSRTETVWKAIHGPCSLFVTHGPTLQDPGLSLVPAARTTAIPQAGTAAPALSSALVVAAVPTPALPISQSFVTLCLVKTYQHCLESVLVTTTYNVNSAGVGFFFLPPFPFPFRDKLIFQLGWDTQITLFLFAKSQGSHSAQGLCKCSHACMWGQPGTCLVLASLSFPKKPFLAGALPATPDVARQHKHSSQTPVRKGLSSIRYWLKQRLWEITREGNREEHR